MKTTIFIMLFSFTVWGFSQTGEKNFIDQNYIEVIGKAEMEIPPNLIYISINLNEKEMKGKISIEEMERKMITKLTEIGVDIEKELVVKDLASNFKFFLMLQTDIIQTKEYILTVHDAKTAAKVFIELQKIDISNLNINKLDHTEIEQYRKEVKVLAIKAAKEKAESLAMAVDQSTGRALYIQELGADYSSEQVANVLLRGAPGLVASAAMPDLEFEKIKIGYSIKVRFELK